MASLLRSAIVAARLAQPRLPVALEQAKTKSFLPFIPVDWIFKYAPGICRDRVRFCVGFNQVSFLCGFGWIMFYAHAPFKADHYDHFDESMLYKYVKSQLFKTGQLEENLRIKVHHFYPLTEE
mmetsp:Transcript_35701/g.74974  ORF Transcript_35701/g.74974 Transcript_35701/m.74974 type:complete len:123 (-) Transcript_35701:125-493(-)